MREQARLLIEREVRLHQPGALERARSWRERLRDRPRPQLLEDLRADRDRGAYAPRRAPRAWLGTELALALRYGAILLTADQQLAGAAERTGCGG